MGLKLVVRSKMDLQTVLRILNLLRRVSHVLPISSLLIRCCNGVALTEAMFKARNPGLNRVKTVSRRVSQLPGVLEVRVVKEGEDG